MNSHAAFAHHGEAWTLEAEAAIAERKVHLQFPFQPRYIIAQGRGETLLRRFDAAGQLTHEWRGPTADAPEDFTEAHRV